MSTSSAPSSPGRPAIIGETLFDTFSDGRRALGGAPFNVAWNLRGMGLDPLFLSAVGDDADGTEIKERLRSWGVDQAWFQTVPGKKTGEVQVTLRGGEPTYEILRDRAYDYLRTPVDASDRTDVALLYHGSLAWRSEMTRQAIRETRASLHVPVFVDVNVRKGCFDESWLPDLLGGAEWAKLNQDELSRIAMRDLVDDAAIEDAVEILRDRFGCRNVWLTRAERGAYGFIFDAQGRRRTLHAPAPPVPQMADAIGAGDAFSAVAIAGALRNEDPEITLRRAVRFAAKVCGIRGAVSEDPDFYANDDVVATEPR